MYNYIVDITLISLKYVTCLISSKLYIYHIYTCFFKYEFKLDQNTPKDGITNYMMCRVISNITSSIIFISAKRWYAYNYRCSHVEPSILISKNVPYKLYTHTAL